MAACLEDESRWNCVLPIGGPGEAITPLQQGECLFSLLGRPPRIRRVSIRLLDAIVGVLSAAGRLSPAIANKAELARIGRYYATESMLVLSPATDRYDAAATPSTGSETLFDYYAALVNGTAGPERGDHAVFYCGQWVRRAMARKPSMLYSSHKSGNMSDAGELSLTGNHIDG
jgi:divinyl chlorophyllide a 8-vinyl-reductase